MDKLKKSRSHDSTIVLDSAIVPTGGCHIAPWVIPNAPLSWTLQCGWPKARGRHYAVESINKKGFDAPSKMFYETLNCGPDRNLYFLTQRSNCPIRAWCIRLQSSRWFKIQTTISHSNNGHVHVVHSTKCFYKWAAHGRRFPTGRWQSAIPIGHLPQMRENN